MKSTETWADSRHWTRTERMRGGVAVRSFDVRWVLLAADWRRRHPSFWDRVRHRLTAARITN